MEYTGSHLFFDQKIYKKNINKMAKKLNPFGVTVKSLLDKGYTQIWIARKLGVKKQRVNYWEKNPVRIEQKRKRN